MKKTWFHSIFILFLFFMVGCSSTNNDLQLPKDEALLEQSSDQTPDESSSQSENIEGSISNDTDKQEEISEPGNATSGKKLVSGELEIHFIDVGQADSTLLSYSEGDEDFFILIDAGDWDGNEVVPYLKSQGITDLDIAIGTHIHADHIGQLDDVIKAFNVEEVWLPGGEANSQAFEGVLDAINASSGTGYHEPRAGEEYEVGPLSIEILNPSHLTSEPNNNSISTRITFGNISFVFTGDAEEEAERQMVNQGFDLKSDILHVGHHGSNTSSSPSFLSSVSPKVAIVSVGANNQYGHPHDEVISRFQQLGVELYSTSVHGTIVLKTDGSTYAINTNQQGNVVVGPQASQKPKDNNTKSTAPSKTNTGSGCVDINTASVEQLQEIKHIGPARAEDIVNMRPFSSIEDLGRVNGIAKKRLDDIKSQGVACVGG